MENKKIVIQKLQKQSENEYALAEKYYSILSAINNLKLTLREIQLVAFTAVKGNITYANVRNEFCIKHDTTTATINNIVSKLKRLNIFIKEKGMVKINPVIVVDFKKELTLQINLTHEQTKFNESQGMDNKEDVSETSDIRESDRVSDKTSV